LTCALTHPWLLATDRCYFVSRVAHDLEVDEFAARPEEDRLTAAEKSERINKQLQVGDAMHSSPFFHSILVPRAGWRHSLVIRMSVFAWWTFPDLCRMLHIAAGQSP